MSWEAWIEELKQWTTMQWALFWLGAAMIAYGLKSHPRISQWGAALFLAAFFWPLLRQVHAYTLRLSGDPVTAAIATVAAIFVGPRILLELVKAALRSRSP
ncbi:hypothetical protein Pyrde_1900 [Pyrodictium delaneyi]|uniref:Uncharacterized protein n=1 Tax=Pyrodictium delaneyi TaxID=1273541 RepID=A0A0P0N655_9CREN|nr:hypothetical protein [Pyrodictium delaneyi]ALL01943.1 hypothetical protein Pyrde_1900 [Pyrodictium delaneyi]